MQGMLSVRLDQIEEAAHGALRQEFKNPAVIKASDPIHFVRLAALTLSIQAKRRQQRWCPGAESNPRLSS